MHKPLNNLISRVLLVVAMRKVTIHTQQVKLKLLKILM